jgi:transcriptional regulator GlxA family with amidase domain
MVRRMLIVAHPGALGMELLGIRDILEMANAVAAVRGEPQPYLVEVASPDGSPVRLWGGLTLEGVRNLNTTRAAVDTLIVVGGPIAEEAAREPGLVSGVRRAASRARRVVGICTGAFILAEAGLLDGCRATTHWNYGETLAARHPAVEVDTEPIYVTDGRVWTSAGVTSGYDLVLALVEADAGVEVARQCAQLLVLYLRRPGTQSQFSTAMSAQLAQRHPLQEIQQFIHEQPASDLSLTALADRLHMSPRHFARVFTAEVGVSPGRYVERVRLETARRLLAEGDDSTEAVARAAGFGNYQALRRAFVSTLGVSPAEYRRRFGAAPALSLVTQPQGATA